MCVCRTPCACVCIYGSVSNTAIDGAYSKPSLDLKIRHVLKKRALNIKDMAQDNDDNGEKINKKSSVFNLLCSGPR